MFFKIKGGDFVKSYPEVVKNKISQVKKSNPHKEGLCMYKENVNGNLYMSVLNFPVPAKFISYSRVYNVSEAIELIDIKRSKIWQINDECIYNMKGRLIKRKIFAVSKIVKKSKDNNSFFNKTGYHWG